MNASKIVLAALFAAFPAQAFTPPGIPPTPEERAAQIQNSMKYAIRKYAESDNIVYGVVTRTAKDRQIGLFKVVHVYKGDLKAGQSIGFLSMDDYKRFTPSIPVPEGSKKLKRLGEYGVIAFTGKRPVLDWIDICTFDYWWLHGWVRRVSDGKISKGYDDPTKCSHRLAPTVAPVGANPAANP